MQFYLNGYKPGDPFVEEPHPSVAARSDALPEEVDVLIVGCGPAGLVLAAQLAAFPDIRTAVIDRKDGPLKVGQADEPVLGRHGRPRGDRLPRHPAQVRDPSANHGNILIIPREGGYLVRLYIELDNVRDREMLENRSATPEKLAEVANRILHPYTIDVKDVGWWAVYEIGQRLTDKFDDVPAAETGPGCRGCSSPAMPATRTAPRPARA